ncbi:MAG: alpha-amylase family glycosyl hydrolase [Paraglaciecola sp.]|nr:alpha-amylase family glycosyl hydrolase [Paraglaciecola sp.]
MTNLKNWLTLFVMLNVLVACSSNINKSIESTSLSSINTTPAIMPFTVVPDPRDAVIYQVNIRTFSQQGNFKGVEARLDNIKALGVNVIYLMPIYPIGKLKGINSPYSITDYQGINPEFGSLADLRSLVQSAHERKLAVIMDFIPNHTAWDHPWVTNYPAWYVKTDQGKLVNPHGWGDVVQLDFTHQAMRQSLIDAMKYWVFNANIDGFRFDYSDGPTVDFWYQAVAELRAINNHKLLLLAEGSRNENFQAGVDYNFGFGFFDRLKEVFHGEPASIIDTWQAQENALSKDNQRVIRYTTNHDVNGAEGTPEQVFGNHQAAMTAFVIAAYIRSTPMIYNGQEIALAYSLKCPFTNEDINWQANDTVLSEYTKLIALFNQHEALRRGSLVTYSSVDAVAFTRETADETIMVLANPRAHSVDYELADNIKNTQWQDLIHKQKINLASKIKLMPHSYRVLVKTL